MSGYIEGEDRNKATLFPQRIDDYITEDSAVRVIDVFVDELDLSGLGFKTEPEVTGRPAYHPSLMLKLFIYGYLNRVQSSRRLEQEANRNVELMWLLGRLAPDFKTIANFRKNNGEAIRLVQRDFIYIAKDYEYECPAGQRLIYRFTGYEAKRTMHRYWSSASPRRAMKSKCTTGTYRRVSRWEHAEVLEIGARPKRHESYLLVAQRRSESHSRGSRTAGSDRWKDVQYDLDGHHLRVWRYCYTATEKYDSWVGFLLAG